MNHTPHRKMVYQKLLLSAAIGSFALYRLDYPRYILSFFGLFLGQLLGFALYKLVIYPHYLSPLRNLPGPKEGASFWNGHSKAILTQPSGTPQIKWQEIPNNGVIYYRGLMNRERIMPTSAKALAEVLTTKSYIFPKPKGLAASIGRLLGIGILLAEGDEHKRQRKIMTPAFGPRHLRSLLPLFWGKSQIFAEQITEFVEKSSEEDPVVDYNTWSSRCALDIIGHAGFGVEFNSLKEPDGKLVNEYRKVFKPTRMAMVMGILNQFISPEITKRIPIQRNADINSASAAIATLCLDQVHLKKQMLSEKKQLTPDMLSIMMEEGSFTDEELKNQLMTFLAAGHETTASSLTWCLYALARNPDMQTRLRNEIRAGIPSLDSPITSPETIDSIRYLRNFCNEVTRFYPPVPITLREASVDTTICDQFIPKGTTIIICPSAINKSKEFWGEDADVFNPDRWDKEGGAGGATTNFAMLTFLAGPRSCIGQKFAVEEFRCMVAALVGRFSFEEAIKDVKIEVKGGITARPYGGMHLKTKLVPGW